MSKTLKRNLRIILFLSGLAMMGYFFMVYLGIEYLTKKQLEGIVTIIAIVSGASGILMSIFSSRQASLDAVKDYFQQGDAIELVKAREFLHKSVSGKMIDYSIRPNEVSLILNFYQLWGLLNKKKYLPIWVFSGSSGVRVVQMYLQAEPWILETRRAHNPFDATEFEELSYRIFNEYRENFNKVDYFEIFGIKYADFIKRAKRYKRILKVKK